MTTPPQQINSVPPNRAYLYPAETAPNGGAVFTSGTFADLKRLGVQPTDAMPFAFYCDDADDNGVPVNLLFEGVIRFDSARGLWYAVIDKTTFRHEAR